MKMMRWDDGLARVAQKWAEKCVWKHGHPKERAVTIGPNGKPFGRTWMGQNLAAG